MSGGEKAPGSSQNLLLEDEPEQVQFLFKTIFERDPKKRRVKPVDRHLLQVDFGLSDSENDSDFEIQEHDDEESDEEKAFESHDDEDDDKGSRGSASDEEMSGSESGKKEASVGELLARAHHVRDKRSSQGGLEPSAAADNLRFLICSVCLGEVSEDNDEIVECDNCGVAVHEGCYGDNMSDNDSVSSVQTDSSTEPWFCDACKAGVTNPCCELCPNLSGIFKETDAGRWVHIVCALYIPGVAFGDVEKLRWVTLSEMNSSKWGAKECCYCEDERFSWTGVCIGCDAGMCKNFFHVTCGQRMGLLSEVSPEVHIADPFYAYCKLHVDKSTMRYKRQNFIAIQSHVVSGKSKDDATDLPGMRRINEKLERSRVHYVEARSKRPPPWVPTEKVPRALTTSASACRKLIRKAELMGIVMEAGVAGPAGTGKEGKRKGNMLPAFSPDFVNYFFDRDIRLANYKSQLSELIQHAEKLNKEERSLRTYYNKLSTDVEVMRATNPLLKQDAEKYWKMLRDISGQKLPLPTVLRSPKVKKTPQKRAEVRSPTIIHLCGICKNTHDQHQLLQCDTCKGHYHLGCLDPPLSRMPKKTAFAGWQCSQCVGSSSEEEMQMEPDTKNDGGGGKRMKRAIREPSKYTPAIIQKKRVGKGRRKRRKRSSVKKETTPERKKDLASFKMTNTSPTVVLKRSDTLPLTHIPELAPKAIIKPSPKPPPKLPPKPPRPPVKEEEPVDKQCNTCNQSGTLKTLVSCDECEKCYHFGCLDPPYKKNPKVRGYGWYCPECIPSEGDAD